MPARNESASVGVTFFGLRCVYLHTRGMSTLDEKIRKTREKYIRYNQTPDRKEARQVASALRARQMALITTVKRLQSHDFDDLVEVARICCQNNPDAFTANQNAIINMLAILHGSGNVQSDRTPLGMRPPSHPDQVSDQSKKV